MLCRDTSIENPLVFAEHVNGFVTRTADLAHFKLSVAITPQYVF